jgi:hypothetical protein
MKNGDKRKLKTRQFNFRFSEDEYEKLRIISVATNLEMADMLRALILQAYASLGEDEIRKVKKRAEDSEKARSQILDFDIEKLKRLNKRMRKLVLSLKGKA